MCRLFGFKSVLDSQVHSSLLHADNALADQSMKHPDGWGVAYYKEGIPHLIRSADRALDDHIFHKVSGVVCSKTVIAHIRKATQGKITLLNSHPFQYGRWIFAHNGNIKNFESFKHDLYKEIKPELRPFILGSTDSEHIFYLLLSLISKSHDLRDPDIPFSIMAQASQVMLDLVTKYTGALYGGVTSQPQESHITFLLTSGPNLFGFNGGQHLKYSTHKKLCPVAKTCPHFNNSCETKSKPGDKINHLIFSSEVPTGENIWFEHSLGQLIGIDSHNNLQKSDLDIDFITQLS